MAPATSLARVSTDPAELGCPTFRGVPDRAMRLFL
jgi:hypothetical protein